MSLMAHLQADQITELWKANREFHVNRDTTQVVDLNVRVLLSNVLLLNNDLLNAKCRSKDKALRADQCLKSVVYLVLALQTTIECRLLPHDLHQCLPLAQAVEVVR